MTHSIRNHEQSDVIIVGDGLVALCVAQALALRGVTSHVVGMRLPGAASSAAAGLLSPSGSDATETVRTFMNAGRDHYPAFITCLEYETGRSVLLNRLGILELALDDHEFAALEAASLPKTTLLDQKELARLEPSLSHARGALMHAGNGFVDNRTLVGAMDDYVARSRVIRRSVALVHGIDLAPHPAIMTATGDRIEGAAIVLAAGAWCAGLRGLPRRVPVSPLRGQMLAVDGQPLSHAVMTSSGYLIPRDGSVLVGATVEPGTFDAEPTTPAMRELRGALRRMCPSLGDAPERSRWAGVRPATPDMLPIIGRDPDVPSLMYACGHGKNGILLAPITGECVASLLMEKAPDIDLQPFSISRFEQ